MDDLREVFLIFNVRRLLDEGVEIVVYDLVGIDNFKRIYLDEIGYVNDLKEVLKGVDLIFVFIEWNEIKLLDLGVYEELMNSVVIFDGRNCYEINEVKERKVEYYFVGRKVVLNLENDVKNEVVVILFW